MVTIEQLLDKIASELITSSESAGFLTPDFVRANQKVLRDGIVSYGRNADENILLFQTDEMGNQQDLDDGVLQSFVGALAEDADITLVNVNIGTDSENLINLLNIDYNGSNVTNILSSIYVQDASGNVTNPLNVSQFINIIQQEEDVDPALANEVLDTSIYELLPELSQRQKRINNFFMEFDSLTNPAPNFQIDMNGLVSEDFDPNIYHWANDITAPQEGDAQSTIPESTAMITRLDSDANTENSGKTLQSLRDTLNTYLIDVDQQLPDSDDGRPEYENTSSGYLKFRQLNQGIIVRNTSDKFVKGLNPDTKEYLTTGFTITIWARFIDKVSNGTLFNFGNPLRGDDMAFGFKLETYVISADTPTTNSGNPTFDSLEEFGSVSEPTNPNGELFVDTDIERFVRLVVYDNNTENTYDSHIGMPHLPKKDFFPYPGNPTDNGSALLSALSNPRIPYDPSEWYFICATFNPGNNENGSFNRGYDNNPDFWNGNVNLDGTYTHHSGYGNKCKVEIISRSDLLRARGYRV